MREKYDALLNDDVILVNFLKVLFDDPSKPKHPTIEKEKLERLRETHTNSQIAQLLGVNVKSVEFYVRKYKLPTKGRWGNDKN